MAKTRKSRESIKHSPWNQHMMKVFRTGKKNNSNYRLTDAMKDAKKSYNGGQQQNQQQHKGGMGMEMGTLARMGGQQQNQNHNNTTKMGGQQQNQQNHNKSQKNKSRKRRHR
jgi:hypothetical protein